MALLGFLLVLYFCLFMFIYLFWGDNVSLYSPGWAWTRDPPDLASQVPGLQICTITPGCSFYIVTHLKLGSMNHLTFSSFRIVLSSLSLLHFHMNLHIKSSISCKGKKRAVVCFNRDCFKSTGQLEECCYASNPRIWSVIPCV